MTDKRFILVMLMVNVLIFAVIFFPSGSSCDATCREVANQFIERNAPEVFETPGPGNEFNPEKFIRDALNDP